MPPGGVSVARPTRWGNPYPVEEYGLGEALRLFREHAGTLDLAPLRGHPLGCWCPLSRRCHADTLLDLANRL